MTVKYQCSNYRLSSTLGNTTNRERSSKEQGLIRENDYKRTYYLSGFHFDPLHQYVSCYDSIDMHVYSFLRCIQLHSA
jgi:hypothetical protein